MDKEKGSYQICPSLFYLPIKQETKEGRRAEEDLCKCMIWHLQSPPEAYLLGAQEQASKSQG